MPATSDAARIAVLASSSRGPGGKASSAMKRHREPDAGGHPHAGQVAPADVVGEPAEPGPHRDERADEHPEWLARDEPQRTATETGAVNARGEASERQLRRRS